MRLRFTLQVVQQIQHELDKATKQIGTVDTGMQQACQVSEAGATAVADTLRLQAGERQSQVNHQDHALCVLCHHLTRCIHNTCIHTHNLALVSVTDTRILHLFAKLSSEVTGVFT